jgi:NAD(P)-dependent dehydrogenase (short-subunit alcohol dehydrogenase family)
VHRDVLNPQIALGAAVRPPAPSARAAAGAVLVVGAGGKLGAAVVEALLGAGDLASVSVLVQRALRHALRGLCAVQNDDAAIAAAAPTTAVVVFEASISRLGRDAAFVQPEVAQLIELAQRLRTAGVRALLVLSPHRAGLLPRALQAGLANLDESAVAALGFDHLVFMRVAQDGSPLEALRTAPQRLAFWMLSQLHWMVPQREQAVRLETIARVAAAWAVLWPQAAPGTRVLPTEVLWQAAQVKDARAVVAAWLRGKHPTA